MCTLYKSNTWAMLNIDARTGRFRERDNSARKRRVCRPSGRAAAGEPVANSDAVRFGRNDVPRRWRLAAAHTRSHTRTCTCLEAARWWSRSGQEVVGVATVVHPPRLTLDRERKHFTTWIHGQTRCPLPALCERYTIWLRVVSIFNCVKKFLYAIKN